MTSWFWLCCRISGVLDAACAQMRTASVYNFSFSQYAPFYLLIYKVRIPLPELGCDVTCCNAKQAATRGWGGTIQYHAQVYFQKRVNIQNVLFLYISSSLNVPDTCHNGYLHFSSFFIFIYFFLVISCLVVGTVWSVFQKQQMLHCEQTLVTL